MKPHRSSTPASVGTGAWITGILIVGGTVALVFVLGGFFLPLLVTTRGHSHERNSSTSLKTLSSAEADFRANDREGNQVNDFWTYDVAGLYTLYNWGDVGTGNEDPISMIELSAAAADSDPNPATPPGNYSPIHNYANVACKAGYWFLALEGDAQANVSYRQKSRGVDPEGAEVGALAYHYSKFGFLAYPDSLAAGKAAFIINEQNTVYSQRLQGEVKPGKALPPGAPPLTPPNGGRLSHWPTDEELQNYWMKLD